MFHLQYHWLQSLQSMPIISRSSFNVSCRVLLGLPIFFLPSLGLHSMAKLASLVGGRRRMCPMKRLLLVVTLSCTAVGPEHVITSSFVVWFCHEIPQYSPKATTVKHISHLGSLCSCFPCFTGNENVDVERFRKC